MESSRNRDVVLQGLGITIPPKSSDGATNVGNSQWEDGDSMALLNSLTVEYLQDDPDDSWEIQADYLTQFQLDSQDWNSALTYDSPELQDQKEPRRIADTYDPIQFRFLPLFEHDQMQALSLSSTPKSKSITSSSYYSDYPWIASSQQTDEYSLSKTDVALFLQQSDHLMLRITNAKYTLEDDTKLPIYVCPELSKVKLRSDSDTIIRVLLDISSEFSFEFMESVPSVFEDNYVYILCERLFGENKWDLDFSGPFIALSHTCKLFFEKPEVVFVGSSSSRFTLLERYKTRPIGPSGKVFAIESIPDLFQEFCKYKSYNSNLQQTQISCPLKSAEFLGSSSKIAEDIENSSEILADTTAPEDLCTSTLSYSRVEVSAIIGLNGARLNAIRKNTACSIKVLPVDKTAISTSRKTTPQQLQLRGYRSNVINATESIHSLVTQFRNGDFKFI